jgi:hypothetical protein
MSAPPHQIPGIRSQQLRLEVGDAPVEEPVVGAGGLQAFFQGALSGVRSRMRCRSVAFSALGRPLAWLSCSCWVSRSSPMAPRAGLRGGGCGLAWCPGPRKTLLAVAGLVSVHDHTWTTDRSRAAQRWSELDPGLAAHLTQLHSWAMAERHPSREEVKRALADDGIVAAIVERFGSLIGLWTDDPDGE